MKEIWNDKAWKGLFDELFYFHARPSPLKCLFEKYKDVKRENEWLKRRLSSIKGEINEENI